MKGSLKRPLVALVFFILIGIIFRTYNFSKGFSFAHDQDLYSWIVKDILVNGHLRLTGQLTSVEGVFIGPLYYYIMAITYAIFKMNPLGAMLPLTILGVINIISFYWVVKRFFGEKTGLIAAFIESISFGMAIFDRWSVPTQPTVLWCVWFLFIILEFGRGRLKHLYLYAVLVGLVWNIHIALLPILPIPIVVYFFSKGNVKNKLAKIKIKQIILALLIFLAVNSPLIVFEIKHGFTQVKSITTAIKQKNFGPTGIQKIEKVLDASGREFQQRIFFGWEFSGVYWLWLGIIAVFFLLIIKRKLLVTEVVGIGLWFFLIILAQYTSKKQVSEYYFSNFLPIVILLISLFLSGINNKILYLLGSTYLAFNIFWLVNKSEMSNSYFYRKQVVDYIKKDALEKNYPCIAVNYIADTGFGVGFRYLFWYEGISLIKSNNKVPIYNIVIPWQVSASEESAHYGQFGVINPRGKVKVESSLCQEAKYILDPLPNYTE